MSLLMVRHAQSTWNEEGRWQGQADPPLSEHGRRQALAAAQAVGDVDAIISSPQQRALQTAMLMSNVLGIGPVQAVDGLHERSAGEWSGLTRAEIETSFPGWLESGRRPEGYESDEDLLERVDAALAAIGAAMGGGSALVVSHGGVLRAIERRANLAGGRIPNLSGRVLALSPTADLSVAERLDLIDESLATGGQPDASDPHRL